MSLISMVLMAVGMVLGALAGSKGLSFTFGIAGILSGYGPLAGRLMSKKALRFNVPMILLTSALAPVMMGGLLSVFGEAIGMATFLRLDVVGLTLIAPSVVLAVILLAFLLLRGHKAEFDLTPSAPFLWWLLVDAAEGDTGSA